MSFHDDDFYNITHNNINYSDDIRQLFIAIETEDEDQFLRCLIYIPRFIIEIYNSIIIETILDTQNERLIHIIIIYGIDGNDFMYIVCGGMDFPTFLLSIVDDPDYDKYNDNPVFWIMRSMLIWNNFTILDWYSNPIYHSIKNNCIDILKIFIEYDIIPLTMYFEQSQMSGKQQFIKYEKLNTCICRKTGYLMKDPIIFNKMCIDKSELLEMDGYDRRNVSYECMKSTLNQWYVKDIDSLIFHAKELEHIEIFDKRMGDVNMFINKELSMHYNYIYKKKIDISVVYPRKYNELLKTIIMILSRYNDSYHTYYLPEELWTHIIIPMFVTNY